MFLSPKILVKLLCLALFIPPCLGLEKGENHSNKRNYSCSYELYGDEQDKKNPSLYQILEKIKINGIGSVPSYKTRHFLLGSPHNIPKNSLHRFSQYIIDCADFLVELTNGYF